MHLSLVTAPTSEPVSLSELKLHLRVESSVTAEDDLIAALGVAAREYCEDFTHRAIPRQTWDLKGDAFPDGYLGFPKAPLVSVTSVSYVDTNGTTQTWNSALYTVDAPVGPKARMGRLEPVYGESYPATRSIPSAVTARFVAGYAGTALTIASLTQAAGLATATVTAGHGLSNLQMVTIAGASQSGYNGSFTATVVSSTVFTFAVATATVSPATGSPTATPDPVPSSIKAAIKILVATWYGPAREGIQIGNIVNEMPMAVSALLWPFKSF